MSPRVNICASRNVILAGRAESFVRFVRCGGLVCQRELTVTSIQPSDFVLARFSMLAWYVLYEWPKLFVDAQNIE